MSIIDNCRTYSDIESSMEWLKNSPSVTTEMLSNATGAYFLKLHQIQKAGWAKITGENRFPIDDEQPEPKAKPAISDGPY